MNSLMDRIKVTDFLSLPLTSKASFISKIRQMRIHSLEEARTKKAKGLTKSARKNRAKRGKSTVNPEKAALAAMKKLTPMQLKKLQEIYG